MNGEGGWEVDIPGESRDVQFVVHLRNRTCICRIWMLMGSPCPHAIAAIEMTSENVDSFASSICSKETFQQVYAPITYPVQGPQLLTRTTHPNVVPLELTNCHDVQRD